ncbi:hypothetical protein FGB62_218g09 [Gracilaria domingensis]|nr:hypothetical protein FGB62_218g09 [Gracilaria domingensis]
MMAAASLVERREGCGALGNASTRVKRVHMPATCTRVFAALKDVVLPRQVRTVPLYRRLPATLASLSKNNAEGGFAVGVGGDPGAGRSGR